MRAACWDVPDELGAAGADEGTDRAGERVVVVVVGESGA